MRITCLTSNRKDLMLMKKRKLIPALSSWLLLTCLIGCNDNNSSNTSGKPSTGVPSTVTPTDKKPVTKVEINGTKTLIVGEDTKLIANTEVTWSSSDETVATVDETGKVHGVASGSVTITATSIENPSLSAEWEISVSMRIPSKDKLTFSAKIDGSEVSPVDGKYSFPLGKEVILTINSQEGFMTPSVTFSLTLPSDVDQTICSVENIADTTNSAEFLGIGSFEGGTLTATCSFGDSESKSIKMPIQFDVIDTNADNKANFFNKFEGCEAVEKNSLTDARITEETKTTDLTDASINPETQQKSYTYALFTDAVYVKVTGDSKEDYFAGSRNGSTYLFDYDGSKIGTFYNFGSSEKLGESFVLLNHAPVYGLANRIKALFDSSYGLDTGLVNFGNYAAYAYSTFKITAEKAEVVSNFDYGSTHYELNLTVNFDGSKITSFKFTELSQTSKKKIEYSLEGSNFVYGEKKIDSQDNNESYLSFDTFYYKTLNLICLGGTNVDSVGDYTNTDKYGTSDDFNAEENAYILPKYKSLAMRIDPTLGNPIIDSITVTQDNQDVIVSSIGSNGLVIFQPKTERVQQDDGSYKDVVKEGTTIFTLTSAKNKVSTSIKVEFKTETINAIEVMDNKPSNNDFGDVYLNDNSNYFTLKASPNDDQTEYEYEAIDSQTGALLSDLKIDHYVDGNIDGLSSFYYYIVGSKVGTYSFKIRVKGTAVSTKDIFTINIKSPLSDTEIYNHVKDKTYKITTSTSVQTVKFTSNTSIAYTYKNESSGIDQTESIAVTITDGKIKVNDVEEIKITSNKIDDTVDSEGSTSKTTFTSTYRGQKFNSSSKYYIGVMAENIRVSSDFNTLGIFFINNYGGYEKQEFQVDKSSQIDIDNLPSYLNGKTLVNKDWSFIIGAGNCTVSVSFTSTHASLTIVNNLNTTIGTLEFDYAYDSTSNEIVVSNSTSITGPASMGGYSLSITGLTLSADKSSIDISIGALSQYSEEPMISEVTIKLF